MKKALSLLLALILFMQLLPVEALAAVDTFQLSDADYQKVIQKVGRDENAWHDGMSWSHSMSSYQKYRYLCDFRETVTAPLQNRYVFAERKAAEVPLVSKETGDYSISTVQKAVFAMESKLNYFVFDMETEIDAVTFAKTVIASDDADVSEKASAYRRMRKAYERLSEIDDELKKGNFPAVWQSQADDMNVQLDAFFDAAEALSTPVLMASASGSDEASFHVIILNTDQIGIEVRTKDKVAIQGAKVTITTEDTMQTGTTGADGTVIFPAGYFSLDEFHRMYAAIVIQKDGYRIWESESLRITAGEALHVQLQEDNGQSYVQFATFRGIDVAHDTEHVYYTPYNDAKQSFRIGVHTYPGHTGTFTLTYTPVGSDKEKTLTRTVTGTANGVTVLDLADTWCRILSPEQPVIMEYHENGSGSEFESSDFFRNEAITTEEAITDEPLKSITGIPSYLPGTSFSVDIPLGLPGLKSLRISAGLPLEIFGIASVNASVGITGNFYLNIGVAMMDKDVDSEKNDGWKIRNSQTSYDAFSDFLHKRKSLQQIAQASTMKDGVKKKGMDLFTTSFSASFCAILSGQVQKNKLAGPNEDPYTGTLDLFVTEALEATVSFSAKCMVGPVPCHVGFDLGVGIAAGVDLPFTFTASKGGFHYFAQWNNLSIDKEHMDIIISPKISLSVYAGVGVKGLLGVYIRGFVGLAINFHIRPMNKEIFKPEITLNAGLQVVVDLVLGSIRATIWEDSWRFDLNSSPQNSDQSKNVMLTAGSAKSADTDQIHYVEASVNKLATVQGVTDYQTVQVGNDFYAFWIEEQEVAGVVRPWLSCARIDMAGGNVAFTPVDLPYLYTGKDGKEKSMTNDVKVVHFDVTSTNDVPRHNANFDMITVAVTFMDYQQSIDFPNRHIDNTRYSTQFYNIVFFDRNVVCHYTVRAGGITDSTLDSTVTGGSVSIAFDEKIQTGYDDPEYFYYLMYTAVTSAAPATVHYGVSSVYLTPDRPAAVLDQYGFLTDGNATGSENLGFRYDIDQVVQTYGIARGMGNGSFDVYALGTLTGTADENGNQKTVLIARDSVGNFSDYRQTVTYDALSGDINSFRYIPGSEKEAGLFALVSNRDDTGRFLLSLSDHRFDADGVPHFTSPRDLGVRIGPAQFDLVDLGGSRALYYLESVSTDADYGDAGYNIRAIYLSEGNDDRLYASNSFHLAVFNQADVSMDNGVSYLKLYADDEGFIQGFLLERIPSKNEEIIATEGTQVTYKDEKKHDLKYFSFRQTLMAEVLDATPEQVLVKPGDTITVLFSLMNTGNIPASKVTLRAYAQKDGGTDKINLASIQVNCEDPVRSRVQQQGTGLPGISGYEAVSRYDSLQSDDTFVVSENGNTEVYATEVLMPDDTRLYRTTFNIPTTFTPGQYEIYVTFAEMTTRVLMSGGRYDASSGWAKMLYNVDTQSPRSVIPPATGISDPDKVPASLTMSMLEPALSGTGGSDTADEDDKLMMVMYRLDEEEEPEEAVKGGSVRAAMLDTDLTSRLATSTYNDRSQVPVEDADLIIRGRLTYEAGEELVHIVVRNDAMADATGIVVTASVDDTQTYSRSFDGVTLAYLTSLSYDVPLSEITQGKKGEYLILHVSGTSSETILENNTDQLPLSQGFIIVEQPEDQFITEGMDAAYAVKVRGGTQLYTYQWMVSTNGKNGPFTEIEGATDSTLSLKNVPGSENGNYYRVVIRDADNQELISDSALLLVTSVPRTADSASPATWLVLLCALLPLMLLLSRKKKHD